MSKYIIIAILLISCESKPGQNSKSTGSTKENLNQEANLLYTTYCAGCHGADLTGNSATGLIKQEWVYGRTRSLMTRNVKFGIPGQTENYQIMIEQVGVGRLEVPWAIEFVDDNQALISEKMGRHVGWWMENLTTVRLTVLQSHTPVPALPDIWISHLTQGIKAMDGCTLPILTVEKIFKMMRRRLLPE